VTNRQIKNELHSTPFSVYYSYFIDKAHKLRENDLRVVRRTKYLAISVMVFLILSRKALQTQTE
jgi:hypothetical protein